MYFVGPETYQCTVAFRISKCYGYKTKRSYFQQLHMICIIIRFFFSKPRITAHLPLRFSKGHQNDDAQLSQAPHIRCDLCFPLLYPLQQKVSPRLDFLQGAFGKKRRFYRKKI